MNKVRIEQSEYGYKVSVNGLDVSKYVNKVTIDLDAHRGKIAIVNLTIPAEIELPKEIEEELFS